MSIGELEETEMTIIAIRVEPVRCHFHGGLLRRYSPRLSSFGVAAFEDSTIHCVVLRARSPFFPFSSFFFSLSRCSKGEIGIFAVAV